MTIYRVVKMTDKVLPFIYKIRRSARVKTTRIVVSSAKVEVVAPLKVLERNIDAFVQSKKGWITSTLDKLQKQQSKVQSLAPDDYHNGVWIPFRGDKYQLNIYPVGLKRVKVDFDNEFRVLMPDSIADVSSSDEIRKALIGWMKSQAKEIAETLVLQYAQQYQLTPRSIRIKTQTSRWGSCGIHNDINLNWLLILAPAKVFEYVVVHELCHIRYKNHAADFWNLVAGLMPDYKPQRLWLRHHGTALMMGL